MNVVPCTSTSNCPSGAHVDRSRHFDSQVTLTRCSTFLALAALCASLLPALVAPAFGQVCAEGHAEHLAEPGAVEPLNREPVLEEVLFERAEELGFARQELGVAPDELARLGPGEADRLAGFLQACPNVCHQTGIMSPSLR